MALCSCTHLSAFRSHLTLQLRIVWRNHWQSLGWTTLTAIIIGFRWSLYFPLVCPWDLHSTLALHMVQLIHPHCQCWYKFSSFKRWITSFVASSLVSSKPLKSCTNSWNNFIQQTCILDSFISAQESPILFTAFQNAFRVGPPSLLFALMAWRITLLICQDHAESEVLVWLTDSATVW